MTKPALSALQDARLRKLRSHVAHVLPSAGAKSCGWRLAVTALGFLLTASALHGAKSVNQLQAELAQARAAKAAADAKLAPIENERNAHAAERAKVSAQIRDLKARIAAADKAIKDATNELKTAGKKREDVQTLIDTERWTKEKIKMKMPAASFDDGNAVDALWAKLRDKNFKGFKTDKIEALKKEIEVTYLKQSEVLEKAGAPETSKKESIRLTDVEYQKLVEAIPELEKKLDEAVDEARKEIRDQMDDLTKTATQLRTLDPEGKTEDAARQIRAEEEKKAKMITELGEAEKKRSELENYQKYITAWGQANAAADRVRTLEKELAEAQGVAAARKTPAKPKETPPAQPSPSPESKAEQAKASPSVAPASAEVTVPDLSAFDNVSEMKAVLAHAGLVGVFKAKRNTVSKAVEFKFAPPSNPPANAKVKRGSPVIVFIYQKFDDTAQASPTPGGTPDTSFFTAILPDLKTGPGEVPNLIGLTLDQAVTRLSGSMRIGSDQAGEMPPKPELAYTIWAQKPGPGTKPEKGQQIVISVKRWGSAKKAEPEPEYTPPGTSAGTVSDDLIGEWEGVMAMPGGKRKDNLNVSISKKGGQYVVSVMNSTQKARVEGGKLVCNQNAWGGAMNFKWSFTGSGDILNTELFVSSPGTKETQTLHAALHRRK